MKNNSLFRRAALLLCSAVFLLASCRKDDKPAPAGENGVATVKYAVDVTPDDNRDWGEATDWLGDGGRLPMLGKPQLPVKSPELFRNVPTGILVEQSSYVYVTFVGEIADFNNALGYYYYDPLQTGELDEEDFLSQLFLSGEDGNVYFQNIIYTQTKRLAHGYTFMLGIQKDNEILPFPAGYVVGFCIFPNSGSGDGLSPINNWGELPAIKLRNGKPFYITTDWQFNEGQTLSHTVGKTPCGDYVFAFEDLNSAYSKSSDNDFNDLVLVVGDNLDSRSTTKLATYGSGAAPFEIPARPGDENECGNIDEDITDRFEDPNFRQYCITCFDSNDDQRITVSEVAQEKVINVRNESITSLAGIEYFVSLEILACDNNQLTTLDVSKNTALTTLYCYSNQLTSLDVSKNTKLEILNFGYNSLTSLDVSKNTALMDLDCYSNQLTSLDVSKNTALTYLQCTLNQLTSLDVSKNTALANLSCDHNQLTSLDVSKNTALTGLGCSDNLFTTLDISKNTALISLNCSYNQLTTLDISKNTVLLYLQCHANQIAELDISKNTVLTYLHCVSNPLSVIWVWPGFNISSAPANFNKPDGASYVVKN